MSIMQWFLPPEVPTEDVPMCILVRPPDGARVSSRTHTGQLEVVKLLQCLQAEIQAYCKGDWGESFGTWTLNKGWQKKVFVCSICIKYHWKTESLSVSLTIQTLRDIFRRSSMFCREIWIASRNRSKREICGGHEWMLQPAPTLWNTGFLLHNLPPPSEIWSSYYTLASFQELYLCSVILFPQKPQVGWHCLYFPPEIWELESLRKFPRNPRSSFSCQATEPLFF